MHERQRLGVTSRWRDGLAAILVAIVLAVLLPSGHIAAQAQEPDQAEEPGEPDQAEEPGEPDQAEEPGDTGDTDETDEPDEVEEPGDTDETDDVSVELRAELEEFGSVEVEVVLDQVHDELLAAQASGFIAMPEALERPIQSYENFPVAVVRVDSLEELNALIDDPAVVEVGRTTLVLVPAQAAASDSLVEKTGAPIRRATTGASGAGVRIAVLDSGIDTNHADLQSSIVYETCYLSGLPLQCPNGSGRQVGPGASEDDFGHGTLISGIIAGDGVVSPTGVAPAVEIESFKVLNAGGQSNISEILAALDEVISSRSQVDIVVLGVATAERFPGDCDVPGGPIAAQFTTAVQLLKAQGVLVIAPAGNGFDPNGMGFPACLADVVSVTGTTNQPARFNDANVSATTDVAAPGFGISGPWFDGGTIELSGTSFSVPVVAGCAALLREAGFVGWQQLVDRLKTSPLNVSNSPHPVPWLNCYPPCNGRNVTRIIDWGLDGTSGNDVIIGTLSSDEIAASAGDDTICGLAGRDFIFGGDGRDVIFGGDDNDYVDGGAGPDRIWGGFGRDRLLGGSGQDTIYGEGGGDFIFGGLQSDDLYGGGGGDLLDGDRGRDLLEGQGGNDTLLGGPNTDYLNGGAGTDTGDGGLGIDNPLIVGVSGCKSIEIRSRC